MGKILDQPLQSISTIPSKAKYRCHGNDGETGTVQYHLNASTHHLTTCNPVLKQNTTTKYGLVLQGWNEIRLFEEAEKFFMSVGLYKMYPNFWNDSMLTKPEGDIQVVCHPTAWDMGNGKDFR